LIAPIAADLQQVPVVGPVQKGSDRMPLPVTGAKKLPGLAKLFECMPGWNHLRLGILATINDPSIEISGFKIAVGETFSQQRRYG
jgi:hypothetical protein